MNDRALRNVTVGQKGEGFEREEHFEITAACEVMAILCLATSIADLKRRLGNIIVGENRRGEYVYARDLHVEGAMCALLKDAIKPNLVQTLEGTPAIVHGGPFANIAHGCNSILATYTALSLADWVVTEAGFGADLARKNSSIPSAASRASSRTASSSWRRSRRSNCTAGRTRRTSRRRTSPRSSAGCPTCINISKISAASIINPSSSR